MISHVESQKTELKETEGRMVVTKAKGWEEANGECLSKGTKFKL